MAQDSYDSLLAAGQLGMDQVSNSCTAKLTLQQSRPVCEAEGDWAAVQCYGELCRCVHPDTGTPVFGLETNITLADTLRAWSTIKDGC